MIKKLLITLLCSALPSIYASADAIRLDYTPKNGLERSYIINTEDILYTATKNTKAHKGDLSYKLKPKSELDPPIYYSIEIYFRHTSDESAYKPTLLSLSSIPSKEEQSRLLGVIFDSMQARSP